MWGVRHSRDYGSGSCLMDLSTHLAAASPQPSRGAYILRVGKSLYRRVPGESRVFHVVPALIYIVANLRSETSALFYPVPSSTCTDARRMADGRDCRDMGCCPIDYNNSHGNSWSQAATPSSL